MALYQQRKRAEDRARRTAEGDPIPLREEIPSHTRTRVYWAMEHGSQDWVNHAALVVRFVLAEWGMATLTKHRSISSSKNLRYFLTGEYDTSPASTGQTLDLIEAWIIVARSLNYPDRIIDSFRAHVNRIFDEADLAHQVVGDEVKPRSSMAMHADIVEPVVTLLHGRSGLGRVERAFQDALSELRPDGKPADAITDAATALQEMLVALGCSGNALGPLLADAKRRGLLGPYDSKLMDGFNQIGHWVSAHRSERGDAHSASDATRHEAWLAVHVAGALILYLESRIESAAVHR